MGCDIHWYSETKKDGEWVCDQADTLMIEDEGTPEAYTTMDNFPDRDRDYWWFGFIQPGVRTTWDFGFEESSLPEDLSAAVQTMVDDYGQDGHSHGCLTRADLRAKLNELAEIRAELLINPDGENREAVEHFVKRLQTTISNLASSVDDEDQRIIFFFDN